MNKPVLYIDDNFKIPDYIEKIPEEVRKLMIEDLVAETRKNMMLNSDRQKK